MKRRAAVFVGVVAVWIGIATLAVDAGDPGAPAIQIEQPPDGGLVATRMVRVAGKVEGASGTAVLTCLVNGAAVVLKDGRFEVTVEADADGDFVITVFCGAAGSPAAQVTRSVVVDTTPPALVVVDPSAEATDFGGLVAQIKGRAQDPHLSEVRMNGKPVSHDHGAFDVPFMLPEEGEVRVEVVAVDGAGNTSPTVVRRLHHEADPKRLFLSPGWAEAVGADIDATTGYPKKIRRAKDSMVMVLVPAGTFQMGAVPGDREAEVDEKPRHVVTLSKAYYVDESEVTVGMWKKYAAEKGLSLPTLRSKATDAHPMHQVSWDDVQGYLKWAGVALPTEAQWERAAKGGHDEYVYPWGASDDVKKRNGSGAGDGFDGLAPVKSFVPNDYGLCDLSGNVWEWCSDLYDEGYYASSPPRDPLGPSASASWRVLRGGSWGYFGGADSLRASSRFDFDSADLFVSFGFRCARSLP